MKCNHVYGIIRGLKPAGQQQRVNRVHNGTLNSDPSALAAPTWTHGPCHPLSCVHADADQPTFPAGMWTTWTYSVYNCRSVASSNTSTIIAFRLDLQFGLGVYRATSSATCYRQSLSWRWGGMGETGRGRSWSEQCPLREICHRQVDHDQISLEKKQKKRFSVSVLWCLCSELHFDLTRVTSQILQLRSVPKTLNSYSIKDKWTGLAVVYGQYWLPYYPRLHMSLAYMIMICYACITCSRLQTLSRRIQLIIWLKDVRGI